MAQTIKELIREEYVWIKSKILEWFYISSTPPLILLLENPNQVNTI